MQIRKQENDLLIADLVQFPVWEYALNEENSRGQNEKTVRPYLIPPSSILDRANFLIRAEFILANGIPLLGYIKPVKIGDNKLMQPLLPYDLNPIIVTDEAHIHFCYGIFKPEETTIIENYKHLGHGSQNVFPVEFRSDIEVSNCVTRGVLEGFLYFEKDTKNFLRLKPSDIRSIK